MCRYYEKPVIEIVALYANKDVIRTSMTDGGGLDTGENETGWDS